MKAVILAGGLGTRLSEETAVKPKPMVEIGGKPIIWHIMKIFSEYGINDFIICCGYKGYVIKEYFINYSLRHSDITICMKGNSTEVHKHAVEPWKVTLIDTGESTMTGGRLGRVREHLLGEEAFCFTYGDGLSDVNIAELIKFHKNHGKQATLTAARPPGRYGVLKMGLDSDVISFQEKPDGEGGWINGGFFVLHPDVVDRVVRDDCIWEHEPLSGLADDNQLYAFKHEGFWQPMDTLRDKNYLEDLWFKGSAPWKVWD